MMISRTSTTEPEHEAIPQMVLRVAPALALLFLAPWVGEFLLGNISIDAVKAWPILVPLYGGGAILVREVARRHRRGWRSMLVLALAYAVVEEALVTQTLFNPSYFGFSLIHEAHIPALGMGAWWTIYVLTLHTVWSIAVPIALMEAFVPRRATSSWLGCPGLIATTVVFLLGCGMTFRLTYAQEKFVASPAQLAGAVSVVVGLIAVAWMARDPGRSKPGRVPTAWTVGLVSFVAASAFMTMRWFISEWAVVAGYMILFAGMLLLAGRWSSRAGWGARHRLAIAGGALLTYAWHSFFEEPIIGSAGRVALIGNTIFAMVAVLLLIAAIVSVRRAPIEADAS